MLQLVLNEQIVDLSEQFSLIEVYQTDKFSNPTTELDNHSYSVKLPATKRNNKVMSMLGNEMWENGAINPKAKIPFALLSDGVLMEEGYAQVSSIDTTRGVKQYSLMLYGGLGDFLYNLHTKSNGDKMKMTDVLPSIDFKINADFVNKCWAKNKWDGNNPEDWISFMPAYNGCPDNFDSDKVMVNISGNSFFPASITKDGKTYSPITDGTKKWGLMKLNRKVTDIEARDLRSYLQRPVIKLSKVIDAIISKSEYRVNKGDFFDESNPYWGQSWIALPLLNSDLKGDTINKNVTLASTKGTMTTEYFDSSTGGSKDEYGVFRYNFYLGKIDMSNLAYDTTQKYTVNIDARLLPTVKGVSSPLTQDVYNSIYYAIVDNKKKGDKIYKSGNEFRCRLRFDDQYGNIKGYSDYTEPLTGQYIKDENGKYWLNKPLSFVADGKYYSTTMRVYLEIEMLNYNHPYPSAQYIATKRYFAMTGLSEGVFNDIEFTIESSVKLESSISVKSNTLVDKTMLWKDDSSPAEVLLSYCKMFNILMVKNPIKKEISLLTREEYYSNDIVNLDVDESKTKTITPYLYNTAIQRFTSGEANDTFGNRYKSNYGKDYGSQNINTGYQFNNTVTDLLKDNVFKNNVVGKMNSNYMRTFIATAGTNKDKEFKPYMVDNYSLSYFDADRNEGTLDNQIVRPYTTIPWSNVDGSDVIERMGFQDGEKEKYQGLTLCFYNGRKDCVDYLGNDIMYTVSDDSSPMIDLNGNKGCWLLDDKLLGTNSLPQFSRYLVTNNSVRSSFDFGLPAEIYTELSYDEKSTIYYNFWKTYYDMTVPSQKLTCYAKVNPLINADCLKKIYCYNNQYWRLNRIEVDKMGNGISKCELFRVTAAISTYIPKDYITTSKSSLIFDKSGGTQYIDIGTNDTSGWSYRVHSGMANWSTVTKSGNSLIITIDENPNTTDRSGYLEVFCTSDSTVKQTVNITQSSIVYPDEYEIDCEPTKLNFPAEGGKQLVSIVHNDPEGFDWDEASFDDSWISVDKYDDRTAEITVLPNTKAASRNDSIAFYCIGDYQTHRWLNITQAART